MKAWKAASIVVVLSVAGCGSSPSSNDPAVCLRTCRKYSQDLVANFGAKGPDPLQCGDGNWNLSCGACDAALAEKLLAANIKVVTPTPCEDNR